MAEQDVDSVNAEKDAILDASSTKKRSWKLYLGMTLLLGASAWYVWSFVPAVQSFKHHLLGSSVVLPEEPASSGTTTPSMSHSPPVHATTPLFENKDVLPEVQVEVNQPVAAPDVALLPAGEAMAGGASQQMMFTIQAMQAQLGKLQQSMVAMQNQQVQHMQMQVRVHLFQLLAIASTAKKSTLDAAQAWKSIALLPMLTADKRAYAEQAFAALLLLQEDKLAVLHELEQLQLGLGMQLVEEDVAFTDAPKEVLPLAASSWFERLAAQFHFSKVNPDSDRVAQALQASQDDVRSMLRNARQALQGEHWSLLPDIDLLVHKLNQQGIETSLSAEVIADWQQGKQAWQAQAQAWMEQL